MDNVKRKTGARLVYFPLLICPFVLAGISPDVLFRRIKRQVIPEKLYEMYRQAGESYFRLKKKFGEYWKEHRENTRNMIMRGVEETRERRKVLILGSRDIEPLEYLARNFEEVEMFNLDYSTLEKVKGNLSQELKSKVEIKQEDITGIVAEFVNQTVGIIERSSSPIQAERGILELIQNIKMPEENILGRRKWDYIVVSLVLSQLMSNELRFIESLLEDKFTLEVMAGFFSSSDWNQAKNDFQLRIVNAMLDMLKGALKPGGRIYLADSVEKKFVRRDQDGKLVEYNKEKMLGVENLKELLDNRFKISQETDWVWRMIPAQEVGERGIFYQVEGLIIGEKK